MLMEERLVLGAGRLYVGRKCGGYRDKPYDGKTHVILPNALHAAPMMLPNGHERNGAD
jgi:hypothetical protein